MKQIDTLAIIGVGLIGGSAARKVKELKLSKKVIGFGRRQSSLDKALASKTIDEATLSLDKALRDADMVLISTPVSSIPAFLKECLRYCKKGCIITDAGSTKKEIVSCADKIFGREIFFVGAHPMAGSEKRGFEFSKNNLFDDSICFITKSRKTDLKALKRVSEFWQVLGAKPVITTPEKHDKIVAEISHLPHVAAISLVNAVTDFNIKLAGNSFRDTTRVASSDSNLWLDIFFSNKDNIVESIDRFIDKLKIIKNSIKKGERNKLKKIMEKANLSRSNLIVK
ncbi:MAG: prephenate dehydrogenase [Candidatus Omnitrophota bacterium]